MGKQKFLPNVLKKNKLKTNCKQKNKKQNNMVSQSRTCFYEFQNINIELLMNSEMHKQCKGG